MPIDGQDSLAGHRVVEAEGDGRRKRTVRRAQVVALQENIAVAQRFGINP